MAAYLGFTFPARGGRSFLIPTDSLGFSDVRVGGITCRLHTDSAEYIHMLATRYAGFPGSGEPPDYEFDVELKTPEGISPDEDASVTREGNHWLLTRGDFRAEWDPATRRGHIRQTLNPFSIDSMLRIVHTLVLAPRGGVLMHAASGIRNSRAFLFSGVSGAGKTTMASLTPPDAHMLTDEISYITCEDGAYYGWGTPFAGELATPGENLRAPIAAIYLLTQGPENRIDELSVAEATRALLTNILFFAKDPELVQAVFHTACRIAQTVPIRRLTFFPDSRVWDLIQ